jgi:hypothetical protein
MRNFWHAFVQKQTACVLALIQVIEYALKEKEHVDEEVRDIFSPPTP